MRCLVILAVGLTLSCTPAWAQDATNSDSNPYSKQEMADALKPYQFRYLTRADLLDLPHRYSKGFEEESMAEIRGWIKIDRHGALSLYTSQTKADTDSDCVSVQYFGSNFFASDEEKTDINLFQGLYVQMIGTPEYSQRSDTTGFGGGWVMYPPLSVPDQPNCENDIGFMALRMDVAK